MPHDPFYLSEPQDTQEEAKVNLRLRWQLYGLLPRCTADRTDPDYGWHCWGLIWPWQRQEGPMHASCRRRWANPQEEREQP